MNEQTEMAEAALQEIIDAEISREEVDELLARLSEAGGPAGVRLDKESGVAVLLDGEGRPVTIMHQPGFPGIVLSAPVCDAESMPRAILMRLLSANASWSITGGGVFAVAAPGQPVSYCRRIALPTREPSDCVAALAEFSEFVAVWEARIGLVADRPQDSSETTDAGPSTPFQA